ncbi:MAG: Leucine-responsive regulatory protein [Alphaproteobacteria bacterium ADurb.BinA280]|jgi:DNA-binding Lrp family transcriptional regulator|nr:Lrp/AsnC family transcriptional regulator [Xanthomonadales bacterium]MCC6505555.1 Lrp/AsnC family transcriptional regulator [Aquimonas sp.]OPZ11323.1 MAG: Leucine-responsive regulatory protein [Alphaproteobacteria bacterium ADurb.BinA280]
MDRIDVAILQALRNNARLPNKTLAERLGIAPSTALERVRRLRESGVIEGYHAEFSPRGIGIGLQAMVAVRLTRHSRELLDAFRAHLRGLPEVVSFYHLAGANDFQIHVAVRDSDHLRDFALTALTQRSEVAHIETSLIFEFQRSAEVPIYAVLEEEE